MGEERPFKKSALGGFNRKDVIEYIEQLMSELEDAKSQLKRKEERISELERKLEQYEAAYAAVEAPVGDDADISDDAMAEIDAILVRYLGKEE